MHRLILSLGANKDIIVDHIDRNGLNNSRDNIRKCTRQQNTMNRKLRRDSVIPYKGVSYNPNYRKRPRACRNPYMAKIGFEGKRHYLGIFATAEEAARAYDAKAKELHGEFAKLNFPE